MELPAVQRTTYLVYFEFCFKQAIKVQVSANQGGLQALYSSIVRYEVFLFFFCFLKRLSDVNRYKSYRKKPKNRLTFIK